MRSVQRSMRSPRSSMPDDHEPRLPDLDGVTFTSVANSEGGDVDGRTTFVYKQSCDEVWAEYSGGAITRGFLVGTRSGDRLRFRYVHLSVDGETSSGRCESVIALDGEGRLILDESWEWESREGSGTSRLKEVRG